MKKNSFDPRLLPVFPLGNKQQFAAYDDTTVDEDL